MRILLLFACLLCVGCPQQSREPAPDVTFGRPLVEAVPQAPTAIEEPDFSIFIHARELNEKPVYSLKTKDAEKVDLEAVELAIKKIAAKDSEAYIVLTAFTDSYHKDLMDVLDRMADQDLRNISIMSGSP